MSAFKFTLILLLSVSFLLGSFSSKCLSENLNGSSRFQGPLSYQTYQSSQSNQNFQGTQNTQSVQNSQMTDFRRTVATVILCGIGGAALGLSTLSFYGQPQEHISNVTTGFGLGLVFGVAYAW